MEQSHFYENLKIYTALQRMDKDHPRYKEMLGLAECERVGAGVMLTWILNHIQHAQTPADIKRIMKIAIQDSKTHQAALSAYKPK